MNFWMFTKAQLNGSFMADPPHMFWGDVQAATKEAGLWTTYLEVLLLASVKAGPWHGAAFLSSMRDAAADYFTLVSDEDDDLVRALHDELCQEMNFAAPGAWGTEAHFSNLRALLNKKLSSMPKGAKVKSSRWFSWFDVSAEIEGRWHMDLLVFLYIGIRAGWWASVEESPLKDRSLIAPQGFAKRRAVHLLVGSRSHQSHAILTVPYNFHAFYPKIIAFKTRRVQLA
jgi:hypothetical protein